MHANNIHESKVKKNEAVQEKNLKEIITTQCNVFGMDKEEQIFKY